MANNTSVLNHLCHVHNYIINIQFYQIMNPHVENRQIERWLFEHRCFEYFEKIWSQEAYPRPIADEELVKFVSGLDLASEILGSANEDAVADLLVGDLRRKMEYHAPKMPTMLLLFVHLPFNSDERSHEVITAHIKEAFPKLKIISGYDNNSRIDYPAKYIAEIRFE